MHDLKLLPPLRLVLNTACNGNCYFCHHEGCECTNNEMSWDTINECIEAARQLNISKISLTGGEPTLREDLCDIVSEIKCKLPNIDISLTTNGFGLKKLSHGMLEMIEQISLSVVSFSKSKYLEYQGVDPAQTLKFLGNYAHKTTINIVVVDDNKDELIPMVEKCINCGFGVDLMFELFSDNIPLQKRILAQLTDKYGLFSIHYSTTPVMIQFEGKYKRLRVKSPSISKILHRNICSDCIHYSSCPEKICALRVYPDGAVSPCLNRHIQSNQESVVDKIVEIYPQLGVCTENLYNYFFEQ